MMMTNTTKGQKTWLAFRTIKLQVNIYNRNIRKHNEHDN